MLTVHHLASSQSERIVWLCEELELPYQLVRYERDPVTRLAPPEYKALHAFGTAPVVTDGDLVLAESGAIVEFLCRRHAGGRFILGPEHADFTNYLYWFHFANGSMVPSFMVDHVRQSAAAPGGSGAVALPGDRTQRALRMIEDRLGRASYFAGEELTAADIMMCLLRFFATRESAAYPNVAAYLKRLGQRPGCRRAMAKAEPGRPALP
jgi:glutathione S-transferase